MISINIDPIVVEHRRAIGELCRLYDSVSKENDGADCLFRKNAIILDISKVVDSITKLVDKYTKFLDMIIKKDGSSASDGKYRIIRVDESKEASDKITSAVKQLHADMEQFR